MSFFLRFSFLSPALVSIFLIQCVQTSEESSSNQTETFPYSKASYYFKQSTRFVIEMYYETGAEPFTGSLPGGRQIMSIFTDNITDILKYKSVTPTLVSPTSLSEMTLMATQSKSSWTAEDVLSLHNQYKSAESTETQSVFYIYFLKGYASAGSSVIGFSIKGTPIIALFKDVIASTGNQSTQKFVEQSTLVHEMGHALGFVGNGVPLASDHQDTNNGAHTTNNECVMFWLNEGSSDLANFVTRFISSSSVIMWGSQVLADAQAYSE